MFPSQDQASAEGGNLEDKLRAMVLNNLHAPAIQARPVTSTHFAASQAGTDNLLRPSDDAGNVPETKDRPGNATTQLPTEPTKGHSSPSRKKLNQAQRRQMSSQLSIPIDVWQGHAPGRLEAQQNSSTRRYQNPPQGNRYQRLQPQQDHAFRHTNSNSPSNFSPWSPNSPYVPTSAANHYLKGHNDQSLHKYASHQNPQPAPQTPHVRPVPQNRQLYHPSSPYGHGRGRPFGTAEDAVLQSAQIDRLVKEHISIIEGTAQEVAEKQTFRALLEQRCRAAIVRYENDELGNKLFDPSSVELHCFGSVASGFATKASDIDLALFSPRSNPLTMKGRFADFTQAPLDSPESSIPRLLEKVLLELGYGARLLTRTRVPIIKLCELPTEALLVNLLKEREKWEKGSITEQSHKEEPDIELVPPKEKVNDATEIYSHGSIDVKSSHQQHLHNTFENGLMSLKQKDHQSIGEYYDSAKRLLKRLDGRDVTTNAPDLSDKEVKILNDVCKAFIAGLSSRELSERVRAYASVSPLFDGTMTQMVRSLHGVWTQIEGENLALGWDNRPLTEVSDQHEIEGAELVRIWRALQDKEVPEKEVLTYNRQLYITCEKLKKISSVQLVSLKQNQNENPIHYMARTQKILDNLKTSNLPGGESTTLVIISRYILGIHNDDIRDYLQHSLHDSWTLQQVGLKHCALHLAIDYENALKNGVFAEHSQNVVKQFVTFLRSRDWTSKNPPSEMELRLFAKIRAFQEPTKRSNDKSKDRYNDHLEFPRTGVGLQCDINFSAHLALHNTQLLRCYSLTDTRVRVMVLFIKHWAKTRAINTPYRGTLSSYGYVLMVLHYLVNVAQPFVCPNLQAINYDPPVYLSSSEREACTTCHGRDVRFWRNEAEIKSLAERKMLNHNHDSLGMLLRGFFEYFAHTGHMSTVQHRGFEWGRHVLSLRTRGGILSKQEKGWIGARTVVEPVNTAISQTTPVSKDTLFPGEGASTAKYDSALKDVQSFRKTIEETKEIRYRYLFAIEDPFELDHNVARTVTHNGIVSIRDEFRRAWRIIQSLGKPYDGQEEGLLDSAATSESVTGIHEMLDMLEKS